MDFNGLPNMIESKLCGGYIEILPVGISYNIENKELLQVFRSRQK